MIAGISHITLIVKDIERTARLFCALIGAVEVYSSGEQTFSLSKEKFLTAGGLWIALMEGDSLAGRTYNHIAFHVKDEDLDGLEKYIQAHGLEVPPPRPRLPGEGRSIYFYDYDNHLFELHAGTLSERLQWYNSDNNQNS